MKLSASDLLATANVLIVSLALIWQVRHQIRERRLSDKNLERLRQAHDYALYRDVVATPVDQQVLELHRKVRAAWQELTNPTASPPFQELTSDISDCAEIVISTVQMAAGAMKGNPNLGLDLLHGATHLQDVLVEEIDKARTSNGPIGYSTRSIAALARFRRDLHYATLPSKSIWVEDS